MLASTSTLTTILFALATVASGAPTMNRSLKDQAYSPSGWHSRATPLHDGSAYDVEKSNVVFGMTRSTRLEPEGFTVLFLKPNVAIDATGRVLEVRDRDFSALATLAAETTGLPDTGAFRNMWSVKQKHSDWPIDGLNVVTSSGTYTVSVYGHDGVTTTLDPPVGNITDLPPSLNKMFTLGKEGRSGYVRGEGDVAMISKAKAALETE
ncbi:hypothetical protein FRC08_000700 [Ceratobasidium sp. 394]|nr:hypothetical protein FRC08_000700 [Ceratobasidium sp. 394]